VRCTASSASGDGTVDYKKFRVLITGSTKGLGFALARGFLENGDQVVVTSRDENRVLETLASLRNDFGSAKVFGIAADVSNPDSVAKLCAFAKHEMGGVDIWINNAGANGYVYANLVECDPDVLKEIVLTNSLGALLCCQSAIAMMREQETGGHVFNMLGAGSDGSPTVKYAAYGHTKAGMTQLTKTLAKEVAGTNVAVHALSPGMVFTELISSGRFAFGKQGRFFVNTLAEPPEVPAVNLVAKIRGFVGEVDSSGNPSSTGSPLDSFLKKESMTFEVLTPRVALTKILRRLVLGEGKDRYYPESDES